MVREHVLNAECGGSGWEEGVAYGMECERHSLRWIELFCCFGINLVDFFGFSIVRISSFEFV